MEEILASIRRIISDDVAAEATADPVPAPVVPQAVEPAPNRSRSTSERPVVADRVGASERLAASERPAREHATYTPSSAYPLSSRAPAFDPFAPRPRTLSSAAAPVESLRTVSQARPAPALTVTEAPVDVPAPVVEAEPDMDAPFAAALMDLAMVEQAVQAELASVMSEPAREVAAPAPEAAPASAPIDAITAAPETATMQVQAKPAPILPRVSTVAPELRTTEAPVSSEPRFTAPVRAPEAAPVELPRGLVSAPTNNAVAASFGSLARTVASNSRSVEDVVTDAVRPMLKAWLDENLPALVERLVRAEIERVARHGS